MIASPAGSEAAPPRGFNARRLWSLWDMIEFSLLDFCNMLKELRALERDASVRTNQIDYPHLLGLTVGEIPRLLTRDEKMRIFSAAERCEHEALKIELEHSAGRAHLLMTRLNNPIEWQTTYHELRTLSESVDFEIQRRYFAYIPQDDAKIKLNLEEDWAKTLSTFASSVKGEVEEAVDSYMFGAYNASVFMLMRVLERGLRALAADVQKEFTTQNWGQIIDQIESAISEENKKLRAGQERNARLEFLSKAAREFFYFKEGWRNHVAHARTTYDEPQTKSIMVHVRDFMNHLSTRLSE
jgi:hypothetical protein